MINITGIKVQRGFQTGYNNMIAKIQRMKSRYRDWAIKHRQKKLQAQAMKELKGQLPPAIPANPAPFQLQV